MLLTDETALEKANEILRESGKEAKVSDWFWLRAEDEKDDIFCYYATVEGEGLPWPPGVEFPLFRRTGEMTDFVLPIPA
jgi:hypothetical protein